MLQELITDHWILFSETSPDRLYNQTCYIDNPAPAIADAGELLSLDRSVTVYEVTPILTSLLLSMTALKFITGTQGEQSQQRYDGKNEVLVRQLES